MARSDAGGGHRVAGVAHSPADRDERRAHAERALARDRPAGLEEGRRAYPAGAFPDVCRTGLVAPDPARRTRTAGYARWRTHSPCDRDQRTSAECPTCLEA